MILAHEMFDNGMSYQDIADDFETENARLRQESSKYYDLYVHAITDAEVWHLQWSAEHQENAKLVDVLHEVEQEAIYAYHCLQQDCVTIANSSEHYFKKWWHAECELEQLKAKNAKLRDYATGMLRLITVKGYDCYGCDENRMSANSPCCFGECKWVTLGRELGIEVQ